MFNRIEVRGIRRQEEQGSPGGVNKGFSLGVFVEGDVIHHHHLLGVQQGAQLLFEPRIEEGGIARAFKQDGRGEGVPDSRGDERSPWPAVARDQTRSALSSGCVGIAAGDRRRKAALIDIDKGFAPADVAFPQAQVSFSFPGVALFIAWRFFSGRASSAAGHARCNAERPRNGAPALFGCGPAAARHACAVPPSPTGAVLWGPAGHTSTHPARWSSCTHCCD